MNKASVPDLLYVPWGGLDVPARRVAPHFLLVGMTGSGKTLSVRMLMRSALLGPNGTLRARAIVYDPKLEFYTMLRHMGLPEHSIVNLNPFDKRSVPWNIARDVNTYAKATHLASVLVPDDEHSSQPFFSYAGQDLTASLIRVFMQFNKASGRWTLHHLLSAATSPARLEGLLALTSEGRSTSATYFAKDGGTPDGMKTALNVIATIRAKVAPFMPLTNIWARHKDAARRFSVTEWLKDETPRVLLLGRDEANARGLDALNRLMFRVIADAILAEPETDSPREIWVFLDEARLAGELEGLQDLLIKGRSRGVRVVLAIQDIQGFQAVYGEHEANEVFGMCGNVAVHKVRNPKTAEWAAELFGSHEWYRRDSSRSGGESRSTSYSAQGSTTTYGSESGWSNSWSLSERKAFLPQEFSALKLPSRALGLHGIHMLPDCAWASHADVDFLAARLDELSPDARQRFPGFDPRPAEEQEWLPLTGPDLMSMGMPAIA
jgi:type IV secretory pathway TraG/TraD family ATPase VirD4